MQTLPEMLRAAFEAHDRPDLIVERVGGVWTPTATAHLQERVERVALGLCAMGLGAGDRVALIAPNRLDWIVADFGILFAGCVVVPIFPTQALDQVQYILAHSEAGAIFVDTPERARTIREATGTKIPIVVFDSPGDDGLHALETRGAAIGATQSERLAGYAAALNPDELAVLIYTSGTTGEPKGVMLSHRNLVSTTLSAFEAVFPSVGKNDRVLTVLPFSHIYEHHVLYGMIARGVALHICADHTKLVEDLREVRPVVMTMVPRIFERMLASIVTRARSAGGARAKLVPWALRTGREYMRAKHEGRRPGLGLALGYVLARALVLRKLRPLLGLDAARYVVSGSAALHLDIALTFAGAGLTIVEGYGATECSPVITVNRFEGNRLGTVGTPIDIVELKLAADGEILVRGSGVMLGYYKDERANEIAFTDGWFRTGDIGELDDAGRLRIVDRKRELYKTSGGMFIAPARIESALKRSAFIAHVAIVAEGRPHPSALIVPDWPNVRAELGLPAHVASDQIAGDPRLRELLGREVTACTGDLARHERVLHFSILPRDLSIEEGELSPTLKVRRRVVEQRYADLIEAAYGAT